MEKNSNSQNDIGDSYSKSIIDNWDVVELPNAQDLDESVMNAIGMSITPNMEYSSNACGGGCGDVGTLTNSSLFDKYGADGYSNAVSQEQIQQGVNTATQVATAIQQAKQASDSSGLKQEIKSACGRKPLFNINHKKDKYQKCANDYMKSKNAANAPAPAPSYTPPIDNSANRQQFTPPPASTFMGMPKGLGITVLVVGILGLGVGGFFLVKHLRKK